MPCRENWIVIDNDNLLIFCCRGGPLRAGSLISRTQALDLIRLDYLDRSCKEDLNNQRPDVVCLWRPLAGTDTHCSTASATGCMGAIAWRVAEPIAKFSREMSVVAKATGVGDLAERLACTQ